MNIVCWKWNPLPNVPNTKKRGTYHSGHVNALYEMLHRNLTQDFKLFCVTDDSYGIDPRIEIVPLWDDFREKGGCFTRLKCFQEDFDLFGEEFISFDLDCVILNNIDHVVNKKGDFIIWSPDATDFSRRSVDYCGSLFKLKAGMMPHVYETFDPDLYIPNTKGRYTGGSDQRHISAVVPDSLLYGMEDGIYNFMPDIHPIGRTLAANASIVFFNGPYLPDDKGLADIYGWVKDNYPLAGQGRDSYMSAAEIAKRNLRQKQRRSKRKNRTPADGSKPLYWKKQRNPNTLVRNKIAGTGKDYLKNYDTINFITFWWDNWPEGEFDLGEHYVKVLIESIKDNAPKNKNYRIIIFTDKPELKFKGAEARLLDVPKGLKWNLKKMFMFSKESGLKDPTICFDLDSFITGDLTELVETFSKIPSRFLTVCRAAYDPDAIGGSIIGFHPSKMLTKALWGNILENRNAIEKITMGSERAMYKEFLRPSMVKFWDQYGPTKQIVSFKKNFDWKVEGTTVVRFHGRPRPHHVFEKWRIEDDPDGFVGFGSFKRTKNPMLPDIERPILITGCPRSRTSMVAGIFDICGAYGGSTLGPNSFNKKGMFENKRIRLISQRILKNMHMDPKGQNPIPDAKCVDISIAKDVRNEALGHIRRQCYENGPWYYKGAKMTLLWPIWANAFPNAKWIIVRRDIDGIVDSCMRAPFMDAYSTPESWKMWVNAHIERFHMMKRHLDIREIWTDKIAQDRYFGDIREIIDEFGLDWKHEKIQEFVY